MSNFERLINIMARLRGPAGCPWDKEQTHQSLKPYLIEEAYELLEAIDCNDDSEIKEELGDLLYCKSSFTRKLPVKKTDLP